MAEVKSSDTKTFDAYEYIAVIAPGAAVATGIFLAWPDAKSILITKEFSLGEFGIFVICAFVLGHLVQAFGNVLEGIVFWLPGLPTERVRDTKSTLLAPIQRDRLIAKIKLQQGPDFDLVTTTKKAWYSITREIYAALAAAGRNDRVDAFNRTYGLLRGIAAALVIVTIALFVIRWPDWRFGAAGAALTVLAIYRMVRFGQLYARELFVQFLGT